MKIFMELPPEPPLNRDRVFSGMEPEHTKLFLGLSRHFVSMSTVVLLAVIVGVTPLLPYATNFSEVLLLEAKERFLYAV
jgi:hypothetical protein